MRGHAVHLLQHRRVGNCGSKMPPWKAAALHLRLWKQKAPRLCREAFAFGARCDAVLLILGYWPSAMNSVEPLRFTRNSGLLPALRTAASSSATFFTG